MKVLLVQARFNREITDRLAAGALEVLEARGLAAWGPGIQAVPGAWEIPGAVRRALRAPTPPDGLVALGAIIQGETGHHLHLASSVFHALALIQAETGVPLGLGILTAPHMDAARARAGGEKGNKGAEAALAVAEVLGA